MSNVDISAIEQKIKMATLDQHRGYAQNHYAEVKQDRPTEYLNEEQAAGYQIVREPFWNKGECASFLLVLNIVMVLLT